MYVYMILLLMMLMAFVLTLMLGVIHLILSNHKAPKTLMTSFECGFHSLGVLQKGFSMQFFMIMVMFVIFDLEVVLFLSLILTNRLSSVTPILIFFVILGLWLESFLGKLIWLN